MRKESGFRIAWRGWGVKEIDGILRLVTAAGTEGYVWPVGERAVAECAAGHPVPCSTRCAGYGHGCGFYAAKDRTLVPFAPTHSLVVVGKVKLAGRVKIHRTGFRAQYAYPLELRAVRTTTPYRLRMGVLEQLSKTYGLDW